MINDLHYLFEDVAETIARALIYSGHRLVKNVGIFFESSALPEATSFQNEYDNFKFTILH